MARRSLILLLILNLLTYMERWVLASVQHRIGEELLPNDPNVGTKMGVVGMMFLVTYMLFSPAFGILGDRFSRWTLVAVGTVIGTIATGATGLAHSFVAIVVARCVVGISEAAYAPAAPAILSELYPIERRGTVLTWFYAAIPVGSALGYVVGGLVADRFGWRWAFRGLVPFGLFFGVAAFFFKDPRSSNLKFQFPTPTQALNPDARKPENRFQTYRKLFAIPSYNYSVAGATAMTFAIGGISYWMPEYIIKTRGYGTDASVNSVLGAIVSCAGLGATLAGGWLADKLKRRYPGAYFSVSGIGLLVGCPLFIAVLYVPFPYAWVAVALSAFALFFNTGPTNAIIANVTAAPVRSMAFALSIFIMHLFGDVASTLLIGVLKDHVGLQKAMFAVALMFLAGGVLWMMGAKHLARDTAAAVELAAIPS